MRPAEPPVPPHRSPGPHARPDGRSGTPGPPPGAYPTRPPWSPPPAAPPIAAAPPARPTPPPASSSASGPEEARPAPRPEGNGLAGADGFASRPPRPRDETSTTGSTPTTSGTTPGRHRRGTGTGPGRDSGSGRDEDEVEEASGPGRRRADGSGRGRAKGKPKKKGSFWRELPLLIVVAVVLTFVIQTFLARIYVIPSASMERTLHGCNGCNNDRVAVDKVSYRFSDPAPGDVVVFRGPPAWGDNSEVSGEQSDNVVLRGLQSGLSLIGLAPPDEKDFVKRVIAVGGQTVACCDPENRVLVDGAPLSEPYLYFQPNLGRTQADFAPIVVPAGQLWVMGDNRNNSADARVHGPIGTTDVIGKARVIVLPVGRWGGVADTDPQATVSALGASELGASELGAPGWADGLAPAAGMLLAVPVVGGSRALRRRVLAGSADRTGGDRDGGDDDPDTPAGPGPAARADR